MAYQFQALTGIRRKPNYRSMIEAQTPYLSSLYAEKAQDKYRKQSQAQSELGFARETSLARERLGMEREQMTANEGFNREQLRLAKDQQKAAEKQSNMSMGIGTIQLGVTGYSALKGYGSSQVGSQIFAEGAGTGTTAMESGITTGAGEAASGAAVDTTGIGGGAATKTGGAATKTGGVNWTGLGYSHAAGLAIADIGTVKSWDKEGGQEYGKRSLRASLSHKTAWQQEQEDQGKNAPGSKKEQALFGSLVLGDPLGSYLEYSGETEKGLAKVQEKVNQAVGTVLCTELNRQGFLSDEILKGDLEYAKTLPDEVRAGYRAWAEPLANKMKTSKLITHIVKPFVKAWAYNMAYKMGRHDKPSNLGRIVEMVGVPICYIIGTMKRMKQWQTV